MAAPATRNILPLLPLVEVASAYTVINGRLSQLTDVNTGGTDIAALTYKESVMLTPTELSVLAGMSGVIVTGPTPSASEQFRKTLKQIVRSQSS